MADYIEREPFIDGLKQHYYNPADCGEDSFDEAWAKGFNAGLNHAIEHAVYAPAADVRPAVRGRWKRVDPRSTVVTFRCSECNYYAHVNATNFCPNCGADMSETCDSDSCPIHFPGEQPEYDPDEFFSAERGE